MRKIARIGLMASLLLTPMFSLPAHAAPAPVAEQATNAGAHTFLVVAIRSDSEQAFAIKERYWNGEDVAHFGNLSDSEIADLSGPSFASFEVKIKPGEIVPFYIQQKSVPLLIQQEPDFISSSETTKDGTTALHSDISVNALNGRLSLDDGDQIGISLKREKSDFILDGYMDLTDYDGDKGYSLNGFDSTNNTAFLVGNNHAGVKEMLVVIKR